MATVSLPDILRLSIAERLQLATAIWESIVSDPESLPLTEDQRREIALDGDRLTLTSPAILFKGQMRVFRAIWRRDG